MNKRKSRGALAKLGYLLLIAGITIGMCASAFGATSNKVSSIPPVLIGNSGLAGHVQISEGGIGALSATAPYNTISFQCPAGVSFVTPAVTVAGADVNGGLAFISKGKAYKIVITDDNNAYDTTATTVVDGVITFTYDVDSSAPTATVDSALKVAALMNADLVVKDLITVTATGDGSSKTGATTGALMPLFPVPSKLEISDAALSDTDADAKYDKLVYTIKTASSTSAGNFNITDFNLALAKTVAAGNVALTIGSNAPGNPGLTAGDIEVAEAVVANAIVQLDGTAANVAIGGTSTQEVKIKVIEATAGALSATSPNNTISVQLPVGTTFITPSVKTGAANGELTFTSKDGKPYKIVVTDNNEAYDTTATTVVDGVITFTYDVDNSAATATVDTAAEVAALMNADANVNSLITVAAGGDGSAVTTATAGVYMAFPKADVTGIAFSNPHKTTVNNTLADGTLAAPVLSSTNGSGFDKAVWTIKTVSTTADTVSLTNMNLSVASTVAVGDITAILKSGTAVDSTLKIAAAAKKGIVATVVDSGTAAFTLKPTADTSLPKTPAGRVDVVLDGVMVVENFAKDITDGDSLVLTLPAGIEFAVGTPTSAIFDVTDVANTSPSPNGSSILNMTLTKGADAERGGVLIGKSSTLKVNIATTVAAGPIVAVLTGTVAGSSIAPVNLTLGEVVSTSVTVTPNVTLPVAGIGTTATIGTFEIQEAVAKTFVANNATITLTLPAGSTWAAAPIATPSVSGTGSVVELASNTATLNSDKSVATFKVMTESTGASKLTIAGSVTIASSVLPGTITATVGGTSIPTSATALSVDLVTAADAVSVSSVSIPTLYEATATQEIGTLVLTEAFAKGLAPGKKFRLQTTSGTFAATSPVASVLPTGAISTTSTDWDYEPGMTNSSNDTLVVTVPSTGSTVAATISLKNIKLNIPSGAPAGKVNIKLIDGDLNGENGSGIKSATLVMGYIGSVPALSVASSANVAEAGTTNVDITGGLSAYTAITSDDTKATAAITSATDANGVTTYSVVITGVAEGTANITVKDNAKTPATATIIVTVKKASSVGADKGAVAVTDKTKDDLVELLLNVTNTKGDTPVQEWVIFSGTVGGVDLGLFFLYVDANGNAAIDTFASTIDPALVNYKLDHTADTVSIINIILGDLGFTAGDTFWYGYVYSPNALTSFVDGNGDLSSDIVFENYVSITLK